MDLIYMDVSRRDIGVLNDYKLDLAYGKDENDFALVIPSSQHCCNSGYFLYIEGTEYGGMVDSIQSDTDQQEVTYAGRTWHGILDSKVIAPDAGLDYLTLSGDANGIILTLLKRIGLADLFTVARTSSGLTLTNYRMPRYIHAYEGIRKMLDSVSAKLVFRFINGMVTLAAVPRVDYTQQEEFDSDKIGFKCKRNYRPVNHLICLGRGELANREVVHLYVDPLGNIKKSQTLAGLWERTEVYDYPNAESLAELEQGGIERLKELSVADEIQINLSSGDSEYDIQDIVGATDNVTDLSVTAKIAKKIVTIDRGAVEISYEVEE